MVTKKEIRQFDKISKRYKPKLSDTEFYYVRDAVSFYGKSKKGTPYQDIHKVVSDVFDKAEKKAQKILDNHIKKEKSHNIYRGKSDGS